MRDEVVMEKRVQPFIVVDQNILNECRKRGPDTSDMLLTYFVLQEMHSKKEWGNSVSAEHKLGKLTGLDAITITNILEEFDSMGVFDEGD